ncbi:MAG TPA: hypothetical protein VF139_09640 [Candidatus Polarisedimenticolaceae bacterium]
MLRTALAASFLAVGAAHAASQGPYSVEILVGGSTRPEYAARGTTYVEAQKGREYTIRLRNHTGRRVGVALSVDGLNSIDAKHTKAADGRKWILDPGQTIDLQGWQTSATTARRFYFTDEKRSYGSWLGRTDDLGVIAAAFFPERVVVEDCERIGAAAPQSESRMRKSEARDSAATGIGRETEHRVRRVDFDHDPTPAAVVSIRYEYRDALVKLGVLPAEPDDAIARRERARGFEDDGWAPDPYRRER